MAAHIGQKPMPILAPLATVMLLGACIPSTGQSAPQRYPAYDQPQTYGDGYERRSADEDVRQLPGPPPAWQTRPVNADARSINAFTYVVRPGDTLRGIAEKTGAGSEAIARANNIPPPFVIQPGQQLDIPAGRYHLVRAGETGIAIARAYGIDWSRIVIANDLVEPYVLRVGMRVVIPGLSGTTTSLEERAAAFRLDVDDIVTGGEPALASNQRPARPSSSSSRILPSSAAVAVPGQLRGSFAWPVRGRVIGRFGPGASGEKNNGIKIASPVGTPILASADGVVAYVGDEISALGGLVILKHGDGWTTVYGHASQLLVARGQAVKKGQTIAVSGDSGFADRPEIHFEMRKGRTPVDPLAQLPKL